MFGGVADEQEIHKGNVEKYVKDVARMVESRETRQETGEQTNSW